MIPRIGAQQRQITLSRRRMLQLAAGSIVATAFSGLIAACNGDDDEDGEEGAANGNGQTHTVEMNEQLVFDPDSLTISVGDTVTWVTVGTIPHTSTCDPELAANPEESVQLPEGAETWDSGTVNEGEEFSHTFDVAGEYTYFCIPHEAAGMIATLTVEE